MTDQICESYKNNPEFILLERERKNLISDFLDKLLGELTKTQFNYLVTYINTKSHAKDNKDTYSFNASEVARMFNVSEMAVRESLKLIAKKGIRILKSMGIEEEDTIFFLQPWIQLRTPMNSAKVGLLFEHYMQLPKGGIWVTRFGEVQYTGAKSCALPEYLEDCGLSCNTCSICGYDCTRKDKEPQNIENYETTNRNMLKICDCIVNTKIAMQGMDLSKLERRKNI